MQIKQYHTQIFLIKNNFIVIIDEIFTLKLNYHYIFMTKLSHVSNLIILFNSILLNFL